MVVAGSSTIKLWSSVEKDLAPLTVVPRGLVGSMVPDWDYYLDRLVLAHAPDSVALYLGDNDINNGKSPQSVATGLGTIGRRILSANPRAQIYFIAIKPSIARWDRWPQSVEANHLIKALVATNAHYHFIDPAPALLGPDGKPEKRLYNADGLHLNPAGYAAWASIVAPALKAH